MDVKNYNRNRKKPVRKKGLRIVAFLLLFIGVVLAVFRYYKFMSKSIYEESVSHLTEVLHQSDQMLHWRRCGRAGGCQLPNKKTGENVYEIKQLPTEAQ